MKRTSLSAQLWAEFVGTAILIIFGDGVVAHVIYGVRLGAPDAEPFTSYNWNTIVFGWAFAVALAVYAVGGITGAHINPAVTIAAMARRTLDFGTGLLYMVAQVVGAFFGAIVVYFAYYNSFQDTYLNAFYTGPANLYEDQWAVLFFVEFLGTFMLLLFIYSIVDNVLNVGPGSNLWPLMVGFAVLAIGLSLGGPTGYAINPARDFGPRVFAAIFTPDEDAFSSIYFLVPIIAPLVGGLAGAFFYDFLIKPFLPRPAEVEPAPRGADVPHEPLADTGE